MRIALVTSSFDHVQPGGVSNGLIKIAETLSGEPGAQIQIINFSNSISNKNSIALFRPTTYRNKLHSTGGYFKEIIIKNIGAIGSEFETLRYRKRHGMASFFNEFDLVIVVTGILQFANVVPKIRIPIIVLCATRMKWERESQYRSMKWCKKIVLKIQIPFLQFQEWKVLRSDVHFIVENSEMKKWINCRSVHPSTIWYPGNKSIKLKKNETFISSKNRGFISVGRFGDPRKGWDRLFLSYCNAHDLNKNLPGLLVIGWGTFLPNVEELLRKIQGYYPIKIFYGPTDEERDFEMNRALCFLQTSYEEGLGLAGIEALSAGKPLICSETYGSKEYVVHEFNGILVSQTGNFIENFTRAILSFEKYDSKLMGKNSYDLYQTSFSVETSKKKLIKIIQSVTNKNI